MTKHSVSGSSMVMFSFILSTFLLPSLFYWRIMGGSFLRSQVMPICGIMAAAVVIGAVTGLCARLHSLLAVLLAPLISSTVILCGLGVLDYIQRQDSTRALAGTALLSVGVFVASIPAAGSARFCQWFRERRQSK